jgi:pyruvate dehydrogenase E2 component (dihydrolipoamide acetyltransferase)
VRRERPNPISSAMPEIKMPKLSDTMTEGTLVSWKKKMGDKVSSGDVIAEIETDKATMEWESTDDGVLTEIYVAEGGKVGVGEAVALILAPGEKAPTRSPAPSPSIQPAPKAAPASSAAKPTPTPVAAPAPLPTVKSAMTGKGTKASPLARKVAAEIGVDLSRLSGSGPGARIIQRDVLAAASGQTTGRTPAPFAMAGGLEEKRIPLSGMRRVIAERLLASKTTIPHFYLSVEVDAAPLMKARADLNGAGGPKLTVNDFVLKAVAGAACKVPAVNASFAGDAIAQFGSVHIAVAVAVEEGLVTPVVRDAQTRSIYQISEAVKDLAARARTKKLKPEEYQGGTITVSNLGAYGVETFSAIINPPQALIISVGAILKKPVVGANDQITAGQRMSVGLSADHRVVDGAIGAQYLAELRRLIESPALLLI